MKSILSIFDLLSFEPQSIFPNTIHSSLSSGTEHEIQKIELAGAFWTFFLDCPKCFRHFSTLQNLWKPLRYNGYKSASFLSIKDIFGGKSLILAVFRLFLFSFLNPGDPL